MRQRKLSWNFPPYVNIHSTFPRKIHQIEFFNFVREAKLKFLHISQIGTATENMMKTKEYTPFGILE